jgi:hypothetical protein
MIDIMKIGRSLCKSINNKEYILLGILLCINKKWILKEKDEDFAGLA